MKKQKAVPLASKSLKMGSLEKKFPQILLRSFQQLQKMWVKNGKKPFNTKVHIY